MNLKIFNLILKSALEHKIISSLVCLMILGGIYFTYQKMVSGNKAIRYTTAAVEKSTLIVSVSGSGQVDASDQIDVTSGVSGELSALYLAKDRYVKKGQLLAVLDSSDAEKSVRDAQIALDDAQYALNQSQKNSKSVETETNQNLVDAYENGYDGVSSAFFQLSGYMTDLKNVLGTDISTQEYLSGYELILGRNSSFTEKLIENYEQANDLFNKNFTFFRTVSRGDATSTIYQLIDQTLNTNKAVLLALDSARHMFDAISLYNYQDLHTIASQINTMQPKIQSDVSAVYANTNSLQIIKDAIDNANEDNPGKIEDAQRAIQSAQNAVVKKEEALADAQKELAKYSVVAPFNGVIASLGEVKQGDTISANTVLGTLVTKQKIAKLSLNEIDAAKINVGQKVTLTFDALPDLSTTGRVAEVDTIGTVSQGVVSYGIKIAFDNDIDQVKPGMSVTADIITIAKSDVLTLPSGAIKSQGGSSYVELVQTDAKLAQQLLASVSGITLSKTPTKQTVEIGISNDLSTEIVSGLKEGDIVVVSTINSSKTQATSAKTTTSQNAGFSIPGITGSGGQTRIIRQ